jgi:hypothetical protein
MAFDPSIFLNSFDLLDANFLIDVSLRTDSLTVAVALALIVALALHPLRGAELAASEA